METATAILIATVIVIIMMIMMNQPTEVPATIVPESPIYVEEPEVVSLDTYDYSSPWWGRYLRWQRNYGRYHSPPPGSMRPPLPPGGFRLPPGGFRPPPGGFRPPPGGFRPPLGGGGGFRPPPGGFRR